MDTVVIKTNKKYKAINTSAAKDKTLSIKAKGVMFYFLSKPDGWHGHIYDVANNSASGRASVQSAIKELKEKGYVRLKREHKNGTISSYYEISDEPQNK